MASLTPTLERPRVSLGGDGTGPRDPFGGGGGGGGRGDDRPDYGELLRRYRLGVAIGLVGVFFLFLSFTIVFLIRLKGGAWDFDTQSYVRDWKPVPIPFLQFGLNTLLLLASSLTLEKSRREAFTRAALAGAAGIPGVKLHEDQPHFPWLWTTLGLAFGFLGGQLVAWRDLMKRGFYISGNTASSFVYVVTGMHAIHLIAGVVALLYAAIFIRWRTQALERRRIVLDVTALYWHSMAILWLYIFALLFFVT
jgi:cytochrome c oxidase subunit 3